MKGSALGATLHYKNSTYLLMQNVGEFAFPFGEAADVETTSHNSTKKEFEPGIVDGGTIEVPLVWDDAALGHIWILANLHTTKQFKYTAKDGTSHEFLAILEALTVANPVGTGAKNRTLTLVPTDGTLS